MAKTKATPQVALVLGSDSDLDVIGVGLKTLDRLGLSHELRILSAHRTPRELVQYAETLEGRGIKVVIAAAGLSAALPGTIAAHTALPVIGLPVNTGSLAGLDALLNISQMPAGVPVAAVTIGPPGATNAAILAARIIALADPAVGKRLGQYVDRQRKNVLASDRKRRRT